MKTSTPPSLSNILFFLVGGVCTFNIFPMSLYEGEVCCLLACASIIKFILKKKRQLKCLLEFASFFYF